MYLSQFRNSFIIFFCLCQSAFLTAQSLSISSSGNIGTSGTNWSLTGSTLTVTGTANIRASVIVAALANGNLTVVGNTNNFAVTVSEAISSTTAGSGLTIGSIANAGAITLSADISVAGAIAVMGGDVQLNGNITSTATGDMFFQGLSDAWSIRLATGKTIEKTVGTGLLTLQGNGRINNSTSVGSILASGSAKLDVVIINEMDEGTAGSYNVSTGNITTNGGHLWISAGAKTRVWNGLSVGSTGVPGNGNYNGIDVTGNISTNGGDILLWAFVGSVARSYGYGDITALSSNRTISSGSGDITLMTRYNDFVNGTPDINISTTGTLTLAPASGANFDVELAFSGSTTSGTFTGTGGMYGLIIQNFTSVNELIIGTYNGTGVFGDTPYTSANTADITLGAAISIDGPIAVYGGDITVSQNLTSTLSGADILLRASGAIDVSASKIIQTAGGDVTFVAANGGIASSALSAIYLYSGSQILTFGGNITLGGGYSGTEGNLYAATNIAGGGFAVRLSSATLTAAGGHIKIYGRNVSFYGDGVFLSAVNISTTGSGTIGIYGDSYGGFNDTFYFGGITFDYNASTIQTVNGNITLKGILTQSQSTQGYGINFYRTTGFSGETRHIQILSQAGAIQITGDRGSSIGGGIGHSSWGNVYFGSPADNSFTASGNVVLTYSGFVNAGYHGFKVKTTGAVTYEPVGSSFISAQTLPANSYGTLAESASSLTIGKSGNTANITISSAQTVAGNMAIYGGILTLNGNLSTTSNGNISLYSDNPLGLSSARTITAAGTFTYASQGASFLSAVTYPIPNLTLSCTGLTIGKSGNTSAVSIASATTINGPITLHGGVLGLNTALSTSNTSTGDISLNGSSLSGNANLILAAGRTATLNLSSTSNYPGVISGTGSHLIKSGFGDLTLTGANTLTGTTTVSSGMLTLNGTGGSTLPDVANLVVSADINASPGTLNFASDQIINNLSIANNAMCTLNPSKKLTINGVLTNNGTFNINSGSTLVQGSSSTLAGSGNYDVQQNITGSGGITPNGRFWYLGSPLSNSSSSALLSYTGDLVWQWNESSFAYAPVTSGQLTQGKSYVLRSGQSTGVMHFLGTGLSNGNVTISGLTRTGTTQTYRGCHLVSNPYSSYLDWDMVGKTHVSTTMYVRTASNSSIDVLETYNSANGQGTNISGPAMTKYIAPMQGFWVKVETDGQTGSLSMDNSMRSHQASGSGLRSTPQDFPAYLRFNMIDGQNKDQVILLMSPDASMSLDNFDSEKMSASGYAQFYSTVNAKKLVINGMKNVKAKTSVPLTLVMPTSKSYTFQAEEFNIEDGLILLEDKQEGVIQDLTVNPTYPFFGNAGTNATRFVVHFQLANAPILVGGPMELESLGSDELTSDNIQIVSNNQGTINVRLDEGFKPEGSIRIFDASGRLVEQTDFNDQETTIQLNEQAGMYFVEVAAGKLMVKRKIVIE
jgi:autotransporter-associated beta strand protein